MRMSCLVGEAGGGDEGKVEKFLSLMGSFGVLDLTRTGRVAMPRK